MVKTLIANCSQNIGQVSELFADIEVERMNKQTNSDKWHKDYSGQMFCPDETDYDVENPCIRMDKYCFVTCSNVHQNF